MNKEFISDRQGISMIILFILGSTLVLGTGGQARTDLWLAIILAVLFSFPLFTIFARLLSLFPDKNLYDIVHAVLGNIIGKIVTLIYIWFTFHLGTLVLTNFGYYLITVDLPLTPMIVPILFMVLLCIWGVKEGLEVLGRISKFVLILIILLIILTIGLLAPQWRIEHILPPLCHGWKTLFSGTVSAISFPFAEIIVLLGVFAPFKRKMMPYKVFWLGLLIGGVCIFVTSLSDILVLGGELYPLSYFPMHVAVSRLKIGDFIQRMEIIPAVAFVICGFIKVSICLMASSKGIAKLFNFDDYRFIVAPIGLLMANFSTFVYHDIMEMTTFAIQVWKYYAIPFEVLLPLIIWIIAEVKVRKMKKQSSA